MTSERIKEIQQQTAYPDSISVQQALLQVWNECSQLPQQDTEKEMFELEQQLDIPNYLKWYNRKPNEPRKTTSDKWKEYQDWLNEIPEISDEKIGESARDYWRKGQLGIEKYADTKRAWINACKWYREQLKQIMEANGNNRRK